MNCIKCYNLISLKATVCSSTALDCTTIYIISNTIRTQSHAYTVYVLYLFGSSMLTDIFLNAEVNVPGNKFKWDHLQIAKYSLFFVVFWCCWLTGKTFTIRIVSKIDNYTFTMQSAILVICFVCLRTINYIFVAYFGTGEKKSRRKRRRWWVNKKERIYYHSTLFMTYIHVKSV